MALWYCSIASSMCPCFKARDPDCCGPSSSPGFWPACRARGFPGPGKSPPAATSICPASAAAPQHANWEMVRVNARVIPAAASAIKPMLARYWKWSATNEYRIGYTFTKPSAGPSVPAKNNTATSGPLPIRRRASQSPATTPTAAAGNSHCHHTAGSIAQRG